MAAGLVIHAQAPAAAPSRPERRLEVPYTQFTLPNGLHVILHEDHSVPIVTVNVWYHVGSAREKPGRTGFAHLFEHLMFMGSGHVKPGEFDTLLEAAGGDQQRLDRERSHQLLDQRAVERARARAVPRVGSHGLSARLDDARNRRRAARRRQERAAPELRERAVRDGAIELGEMLYPEGHPYHWPVIGYMEDLTAASYDDVVAFFKKYYAPSNASLVVAGDIDPAAARAAGREVVRRRQAGPGPVPPIDDPGRRADERAEEDDSRSRAAAAPVSRLADAAALRAGRRGARRRVADVLAGGKNSRLYKRLVYDMQIAQDVSAFQASQALVVVPDRRHAAAADTRRRRRCEKIAASTRRSRSCRRAARQRTSSSARSTRSRRRSTTAWSASAAFGGKADQLNAYFTATGDPDWFNEDLARYR